jgi:hypothetical protein
VFEIDCSIFYLLQDVLIQRSSSRREAMQIQTKVFSWPDHEDHVFLLARGLLNASGLEQIFNEVAVTAGQYFHCKVLIDLIDTDCLLEAGVIDTLFHEARPELTPKKCVIALVAPPEDDSYSQLSAVSTSLVDRGFRIAAFRNTKSAVEWLANPA